MRDLVRRIYRAWNWTDTTVYVSNILAFGLFIGNCWWESLAITYAAVLLALAVQTCRAWHTPDVLREALAFGTLAGWMWPFGEWFVVRAFGWWGRYVATGPMLLDTPAYTALIGSLAGAYCFYMGRRTLDLGYGPWASGLVSGTSALGLGILGEGLFVEAGMWVYDPSPLQLFSVPLFVPIAYGAAYAWLPLLQRFRLLPRAFLFNLIMLALSMGLGLAVGFFPRP